MVSWTSVNEYGAKGAFMESNYNPKDSKTSEPIYREVWNPSTMEMSDIHE